MTKKDRIAIAISVVLFLAPLAVLMAGEPVLFVLWSTPIVLYWAYRFVKGDISFFLRKNNNDNKGEGQ